MDIRFGFLLPWPFRFIGLLLLFSGIVFLTKIIWLGVALLIVGAFIVSAYEGFEIDREERKYREYNAFFFVKTGKYEPYAEVDKLYINRSKESQRMYTAHTNQSATFSNEIFNGFIKLSNGEKILLSTRKDKDALVKKLLPLSEYVGTQISDNT